MIASLIIVGILVFLSAFFSGVETAYVSLSNLKLRHMVEKGRKNANLVKLLKEDYHSLITTILIGNNIVNLSASALVASMTINAYGSNAVGIATGILTLVILVFGEISPKAIAIAHNEWICLHSAKIVWVIMILLLPLRKIVDIATIGISRLFGGQTTAPAITEDEIKSAISIGEEAGSIEKREKVMIHNILRFNDITVQEIMTPRTEMICVNAGSKISEVIHLFTEEGYSRLPVYEKRIDNLVGLLYVKDVVEAVYAGKRDISVRNYMKKLYFVPLSKKLDDLLVEFQKSHTQLAVVIDEYGGVAGLVTIEDLLEEIVGEIYDETDEREIMIRRMSENVAIVKGSTNINKVNEKLGLNIKTDNFETVSGYVLSKLERIPKAGDKIEDKRFDIIVRRMSGQRIDLVKVIKK